jgi:hypothetical protein
MKQEIYQDGKLKLTLTSTDGSRCDIVTMPKVLLKECSLTAEGFEGLFFTFLKGNISHTQAYEQAENVHYEYFEKRKYKDYEVFKSVKSRRFNK